MRSCSESMFVANVRNGDIGVICASNLFATLQNWFRKKFNEGDLQSSHGFYVKTPPQISEANGIIISSNATFLKDIGDSTKSWFFRYKDLTAEQLDDMNHYVEGAEETGGHYSIWGIGQFLKSFISGNRNMKDESGVFCTEYTSRIINAAKIPYNDLPPWQIDPSTQLNWFMSNDANSKGWELIGFYDGKGSYFIQ